MTHTREDSNHHDTSLFGREIHERQPDMDENECQPAGDAERLQRKGLLRFPVEYA